MQLPSSSNITQILSLESAYWNLPMTLIPQTIPMLYWMYHPMAICALTYKSDGSHQILDQVQVLTVLITPSLQCIVWNSKNFHNSSHSISWFLKLSNHQFSSITYPPSIASPSSYLLPNSELHYHGILLYPFEF